jgi:hypothetical protein
MKLDNAEKWSRTPSRDQLSKPNVPSCKRTEKEAVSSHYEIAPFPHTSYIALAQYLAIRRFVYGSYNYISMWFRSDGKGFDFSVIR